MRVVFVGAGSLTVSTAALLARWGHQVVVVERDLEVIEALREELDCGFLHGDATRPALLREADPGNADVLLCLTGSDQANLIASLVGRSLGFPRVVTRIADEAFVPICIELGLENSVVPSRTIARYLADMVEGRDHLELSAAIQGDARVLVFVAREEHAGPASELGLPADARATHLYRDGSLHLVDPDTRLHKGDQVVVVTHARRLDALRERFARPPTEGA